MAGLMMAFVCPSNAPADTPPVDTPSSERSPAANSEPFVKLRTSLQKRWPDNRTHRIVFHGHSVPAGYFKTPQVRRYDSYPTLWHRTFCQRYPHAVIDLDVTAIGGENSVRGAQRFERDVLSLNPDLVLIDYALNDRGPGLVAAKAAWISMIRQCQARNIPVVLLTPTPDRRESIKDPQAPLAQHAAQIRLLAETHANVQLVDAYAEFRRRVTGGESVDAFLSQVNHPNRNGHEVVAKLIAQTLDEAGL